MRPPTPQQHDRYRAGRCIDCCGLPSARHRAELRKALPPDQPCPYAIRTEEDR